MADNTPGSTSTTGYGQQTPYDANTDFAAAVFLTRQLIAQIETTKLVQVKKVTSNGTVAAAGTVDVLPLVNQVDSAGNATKHGIVHGIPWFRLQGGLNAVICDPVVDDIGYVVVSDRDISNVKSTKAQANPGSSRQFDLADGVYVGGILNAAPTQYVLFAEAGIKIVDRHGNVIETTSSGITLTNAAGKTITMGASAVTIGADLIVQGTVAATGAVSGAGHSLSTHQHISNTPGNLTSAPVG